MALAILAAMAGAHAQTGPRLREDASTSAKASASAKATADKTVDKQGPATSGPAYFVRNLDNPRERREARADILDTPVLPGSIVKAVALVAALEEGVIRSDSNHMCRRTVTVDGQKYVCAHPDLKRALSPAEALAYSCNDFFVSLAPRLSRERVNRTRLTAGLPPLAAGTALAPALVGLAGPRTSPRAMIAVLARLAGAGKDTPVPMTAATKAVLLDGLRGAAEYGTASALKAADVSALAKTGSILMPSGVALGLVVALTPADRPTHGVVVAAPGGAGVDAAAIAADVLTSAARPAQPAPPLQAIRLGRTLANGQTRIETIAIDVYIAQVLAGEGQPRAGDAAQQALAITARTFAIANRNRHRREGFDLCDTTHCQVVRAATPTTTRAAQATSGRLLLSRGQPAFVFYSASCGGRTELASEVWPGAIDYADAASVQDDADASEPAWESDVRVREVERALRNAGLRGDRLRDVRVLARNPSGRVSRVRVEGFTPSEMSGHEFRMAVGRVAGFAAIKSTAFDVRRTSSGYHFRGRGFGHGVGLCVIGAGTRAARGSTADEILKFYYPGLTIGAGLPSALTTNAPAPPAPPAPPALPALPALPAPTDIALALPGNEEGERASLLSLIRRSRDEIVKATGAKPPARLRVTVHPSVDSFGRATGQPWWVSGATDGAAIDLLPLTTLKQRGQLERTLRHEVAHALLDDVLSSRPMWVREGAAAYFATPPASRTAASRVTCPKDAELLRAISAGAQREAYARAEACFARAIGEGKRWDQVR
ncbi:MAG: SpoIID/LytB domain-containing protein [Acidobacteriota bacterium]|nr:SpoIID/LytB domain-containing protein [Acidobacteriota bacterium]